ncbi:MAG: Crp/Fnr family transcriptional regulator [Proteobacteria bacterium]|jgi:CRP/FNR family transcriptional regulator|nr:Crp/Fnr family transcriptional regulator [Pseudomonadota bacterium]MCG6935312.1 Crp/Fnr family transcriptional regulator [Pseudomonadota bacterium]
MSAISEHVVNPFADISTNIETNDFFSIDDEGDAWSDAHANFLSSLSESETQDLLKCSRRMDLKSRDHLFRAGDRSNDVYIVAGGCIRLFQVSSTGKETILWFSFPGEIFGMAELWRGSNRQIYAVANEATQVYSIRRKDFTNFLGAHPEAAMKAISILSARVRALGHALVGLASDNVETRVARLLVRLAAVSSGTRCCAGYTEGELCVNVRLTHQDIANLIGASRQTVSSTLAHLRKIGAVRTVSHHFHIVQPDHLRRLLQLSAA